MLYIISHVQIEEKKDIGIHNNLEVAHNIIGVYKDRKKADKKYNLLLKKNTDLLYDTITMFNKEIED